MRTDKNILKGNKQANMKVVTKKEWYALIEVKYKDKEGNTFTKEVLYTTFGERIVAKAELHAVAKSLGGVVTRFEAFKN